MNKLIGGLCLIIGTTIGAGMLALPVATAHYALWSSSLLMIGCWALMNAGALLILEANLWCGPDSNLISMARKTVGPINELLTWFITLLLLYSLLCAYISGGSQIVHHWLTVANLNAPHWLCTILFTLIMGSIVLCGMRVVDLVNRNLMGFKMLALIILLLAIMPFVKPALWQMHSTDSVFKATTVIMTSFGFATIIPSLRTYFGGNIKQLRFCILVGSAIPLILYLAWTWIVHGVIPIEGATHSLSEMLHSGNASSHLADDLTFITESTAVQWLATFFTSVCVLTSFLGVALSLSDFLADGTRIAKAHYRGKIINMVLCFVPPVIIVIAYPTLFIKALSYAGICCLILLVFIPALMVWNGRYRKQLGGTPQLFGGQKMLYAIVACALTAAVLSALGY